MNGLRLRLAEFALMLAAGLGCCLPASAASETAAKAPAPMPTRQLLVMLHLPAPHFRPDTNYSGGYTDDPGHKARHRIAEELASTYGLKLVSDWPMSVLGVDCYVMEQPAGASFDETASALSRDARVEWVQPVGLFHALGQEDPLYRVQPSAQVWHVAEIHKVATGRNVRVAVVDSGIDDRHPDLVGQIAIKENFVDGNPYVPEAHGTGVAGIIAARAGDGDGIEGVAPDARLMALRACWQTADRVTQCSSFTLSKAINFAIMHDAQIINLSLTGPSDRLLQRLLDAALARGIKVVGAVDPQSTDGGFPASYPGVLAVADDEPNRNRNSFLVAPGRDIPTTTPGARWGFVSGSSYAAAHVSGMMALLTQLQPLLTPKQMREEMESGSGAVHGAKVGVTVDACAVIGRATGNDPCPKLARR